MSSRLITTIVNACLLGILSLTLIACQDTVPARSTINPGSISGDEGTDGTDTPTKATRPDGAVKFNTDFCGCKDTKPITYGNCSSFCSDKNTNGDSVLFATFSVTADISLNSGLVNLNGWCNNTIVGSDEGNPRCVLKAKDENNNEVSLDVTAGSTTNSLRIPISTLAEDKGWVITLVETTSGAKSDSVQIVKFSADIAVSTLGPLKNAPITQYSCIHRPASEDQNNPGDIYYDAAFRVHFYFLPRIPPNPIAAGSDIICHDFMNPLYGAIDDILYPRLEQSPGIFNLWDSTDPRFYDNNGNGNDDVNDVIIQKTKNFGATIAASTRFFQKFPVLTSTESTTQAGTSTATVASMGYYMAPWIDQTTFKSYCLNSTHYASSNPLFKAMRDVVGVDMEGIYVGVKAPETVLDREGNPVAAPDDFLLIRETDLKQAWFYMKNGVPTVPTDAIVSSVPVFFYYPLNLTSPFIRSSTQRIYQVKGANELSNATVSANGSSSTGLSTNYPPHDRKIGCIPKF